MIVFVKGEEGGRKEITTHHVGQNLESQRPVLLLCRMRCCAPDTVGPLACVGSAWM